MSDTELRVTYRGGDPVKIRFGRGYFGDPTSLAQMSREDEGVAVVMFDNAGSTDFERELRKLPFVDEVRAGSD